MASRVAPLPEAVARELIDSARAVLGSRDEPRIRELGCRQHPYSAVFHLALEHDGTSSRIYLKVPPSNPRNEATLRRRLATEYRVLCDLHRHFQDVREIGVVRPLAFLPSSLAIATFEAEGHTLRRMISRHARRLPVGRDTAFLRTAVRLCGEWIAEFQRITAVEAKEIETDTLFEYCTTRIRLLLEESAVPFDRTLADAIAARLADVLQRCASMAVAHCGRHNDFAAHNIIARHDSIRVLDFSMFDHGPAAFDPCYFWCDLESLKADISYDAGLLEELQASFLAACPPIDRRDPLFEYVRCRHALNRLLTLASSTRRSSLSTLLRRRSMAKHRDWLVQFARGRELE